jgi:hypothetical protein
LGDEVVFVCRDHIPSCLSDQHPRVAIAPKGGSSQPWDSGGGLFEEAAAVGLSLVVSYFDAFKKATYVPTSSYQPDWHVPFWASIWAGLVAYYFVAKLAAIVTKEGEEFKSKEFSSELDRVKVAVASLGRQRSLLVKIAPFARNMVSKKITRLCSLIWLPVITVKQFVDELNPELQVQANVKLIHEFFKPAEGININLRLALWMKASADTTEP